MAPSYVTGALASAAPVQQLSQLLQDKAASETVLSRLGRDTGLADAQADLDWTGEQGRMAAAARALQARLASEDAAMAAQGRAWNAEEQSRRQALTIASNNERLQANAAALSEAQARLDKATNVKPEKAFTPKHRGKVIKNEAEVGSIRLSVAGSNSVEEALTKFRDGPKKGVRNAAVEDGIRQAFTRDGRVKDSFAVWKGEVERDYFGAWQNRASIEDANRQRAANVRDNQDGLGSIANVLSKVGRAGGKALDFGAGVMRELSGDIGRPIARTMAGAIYGEGGRKATDYLLTDVKGLPTSTGQAIGGKADEIFTNAPGMTGKLWDAASAVGTIGQDPLNFVPAGLVSKPIGAAGRAAGLPALSEAAKATRLGQTVRKGAVPFTSTRDFVHGVLPGGRVANKGAANKFVDRTKTQLDQFDSFVNAADESIDAQFRIASDGLDLDAPMIAGRSLNDMAYEAFDIGGDVTDTVRALVGQGRVAEAAFVKQADGIRKQTYDTLVKVGVEPEKLRNVDDYIRHAYTKEGREALGLPPLDKAPTANRLRTSGKTGTQKKRTFEPDSSAAEKAAALGVDEALIRRPFTLIADSFKAAKQVEGRANMADNLGKLADDMNLEGIIKKIEPGGAAPKGFTKIAPNRYVADDILGDITNLQKGGSEHAVWRGYDKGLNTLRGLTLLNPAAAAGYMARNGGTAFGVNALAANITDPRRYARVFKLHNALGKAIKMAGGRGDDAIRAALVDGGMKAADVDLMMQARKFNVAQPGRGSTGRLEETTSKRGATSFGKKGEFAEDKPIFGTRLGSRANKHVEEVPRIVLFEEGLKRGKSADEAAEWVASNHFRYSAHGKTRLERDVASRASFFYTFATRYPKQFSKLVVDNPRVAAIMQKIPGGLPGDEERNQYDQPLGWSLESPLTSLAGTPGAVDDLQSVFTNADIGESSLMSNPLINSLLEIGDDRPIFDKLRDALPPLDRAARDASDLAAGGERASIFAGKLTGAKFGKDYSGDVATGVSPFDTEAYSEIDWEKADRDSLFREVRRLNIPKPPGASDEALLALIEGANGQINQPAPSRSYLNAAAKHLNLTSDEITRLGDSELEQIVQQGNVMPALPKESDLSAIGKLYNIKGWSDLTFPEKLQFSMSTPEGRKLLQAMQKPGYASGRASDSYFEDARELEQLRGLF